MLIEIFLEFFVGVVDVELFKPVYLGEEGVKNMFCCFKKETNIKSRIALKFITNEVDHDHVSGQLLLKADECRTAEPH